MRLCKKCENKLPWQKKIDGKTVYFGSRKFCLICSPKGEHNTRSDDPSVKPLRGKPINGKRPYSQWSIKEKEKHRIRVGALGKERKIKLVKMAGDKCIKCNYNKCMRSLTFHHFKGKKLFGLTVKNLQNNTWEDIIKEFQKCILVCANCHGEIHENAGL